MPKPWTLLALGYIEWTSGKCLTQTRTHSQTRERALALSDTADNVHRVSGQQLFCAARAALCALMLSPPLSLCACVMCTGALLSGQGHTGVRPQARVAEPGPN